MNHDDDDDDKQEDNKKLLVKNHNQKQGPGTLPEDAKRVYCCGQISSRPSLWFQTSEFASPRRQGLSCQHHLQHSKFLRKLNVYKLSKDQLLQQII